MNAKEQERRFLKLGHTIARQAVELPPQERRTYIRQEVADLQQICEPVYRTKLSSPGRELVDSMEEWVTRLVEILEKDS